MSTTKNELLKTIRRKCMDCTADQKKEIELCPIRRCALWPFRFATDPDRPSRPLSETQKANVASGRKKAARRN